MEAESLELPLPHPALPPTPRPSQKAGGAPPTSSPTSSHSQSACAEAPGTMMSALPSEPEVSSAHSRNPSLYLTSAPLAAVPRFPELPGGTDPVTVRPTPDPPPPPAARGPSSRGDPR